MHRHMHAVCIRGIGAESAPVCAAIGESSSEYLLVHDHSSFARPVEFWQWRKMVRGESSPLIVVRIYGIGAIECQTKNLYRGD